MDPSPDYLPLFPLHTVLFPGQALPLHVFEPRYREMIGLCLESARPFGVVLIRAGREVGAPATPHPVGTTAEIVRCDRLPDGRMRLLCRGRARFRIRTLHRDRAFLGATVEPLPPDPGASGAPDAADRLRARLAEAARALAAEPPALPTDPAELAFAVAASLPLPVDEQQRLLELDSTAARLRALAAALERELRLRGRVGDTRPVGPFMVPDPPPN